MTEGDAFIKALRVEIDAMCKTHERVNKFWAEYEARLEYAAICGVVRFLRNAISREE